MKWFQKLLIGLVAFLTLGIITPTHDIWNNLQEKESSKEIGPSIESDDQLIEFTDETADHKDELSLEDVFVVKARELSYEKFGSKIAPVISNEFEEVVFPKIDRAIRETLQKSIDLHKQEIAMSEKPAGDYSEKIFNLYDETNRKDLIRFHVRTDKRPQEGYYFNFHYHKMDDNYMKHYALGDIFWSKDTPPKWLS